MGQQPLVAIVMGSQSDWPTMQRAAQALDALGVAYEARIVSAHRTPDRLTQFAKGAADAGFKVIVAGAGGAAHLPGMVASMTHLPVLGVPVESKALKGQDLCCRSSRCPRGFRSVRWPSARRGRPTPGCWRRQFWRRLTRPWRSG
jgi:5-(carboxyamino)imidazole ribonucleotide mutase